MLQHNKENKQNAPNTKPLDQRNESKSNGHHDSQDVSNDMVCACT